MPVISMACPKCGKQATEYDCDKWQCLYCGIKFVYKEEKAPIVHVNQVYRSGGGGQPLMCCPKCGNTNVQLKKMVYEAGTQKSSFVGGGVGLDARGIGLGLGQAGGVTTSLLAERCKPPTGATAGIGVIALLMLAGAVVCFANGVWLGFGIALSGLILAGAAVPSMARDCRRQSQIWAETAICLTCGEEFLTPEGQRIAADEREEAARRERLSSEKKAQQDREWAQYGETLQRSFGRARRGVGRSAVAAARQVDRVIWTMSGGPGNVILHNFLMGVVAIATVGAVLLIVLKGCGR
jgi:hypothetical protein